eukprot:scaffold123630_cov24-Prasinocladus_malaysianus.AAC.1
MALYTLRPSAGHGVKHGPSTAREFDGHCSRGLEGRLIPPSLSWTARAAVPLADYELYMFTCILGSIKRPTGAIRTET